MMRTNIEKSTISPRLLFLTPCAFNALSGGGITFTNLFNGWPTKDIATITSDHIEPSTKVCDRYYFLTQKELPWSFPFSLARIFGGQEKVFRQLKTAQQSEQGKSIFSDALHSVQKGIQRFVGDEIPVSPRLTPQLRAWIADFKPQLLFTLLGNLPYMRLARLIADEFDLPLVIHMMDDWPEMLYRRGILGAARRRRMVFELQELIDRAAACLSICDAMSDAFEERYGRRFYAFSNALPADLWLEGSRKEWKAGKPFRIVYAGALMENSQLTSVLDAAEAVASLRAKQHDIVFEIHAPWFFAGRYRKKLERDGVSVFDMPETMDIEPLFSGADLLLLPVNFDSETVRYVRYSMPTKIPAYMFSGTPTLAYGPESVASIRYAREWAEVVCRQEQRELINAIRKLMIDESRRKELAQYAQTLAQKKHDRAVVAPEFHRVFQHVAGKSLTKKPSESL